MKKILLALTLPVILLSADIDKKLEIISTYKDSTNSITPGSHVGTKDGLTTIGSLELFGSLTQDITYDVKFSNRLEETCVDKAVITYDTILDNNMFVINYGTIQSFKGIFDNSKNNVVQPPMITKSSGVYNDEFMSGLLDTTIGQEIKYSRVFDNGLLLSGSLFETEIRITDKKKSEQAIMNYESTYTDLVWDKPVKGWELSLDYKQNLNIFVGNVQMEFKSIDVSGLTTAQKYLAYQQTQDTTLSLTSEEYYKINIDRMGLVYTNSNMIFGYEEQQAKVDQNSKKIHTRAKGHYVYLGTYGLENNAPYVSYSWSKNTYNDLLEEYTIGNRYSYSDNLAFVVEYTETDWLQTDTVKDYYELKNKANPSDRNYGFYNFQVIYTF